VGYFLYLAAAPIVSLLLIAAWAALRAYRAEPPARSLSIFLALSLALAGCSERRSPASGNQPSPRPSIANAPRFHGFARPAFAYAGAAQREVSLSDIAERAIKSVVNISSVRVVAREPGLSPFHGNPFFDR